MADWSTMLSTNYNPTQADSILEKRRQLEQIKALNQQKMQQGLGLYNPNFQRYQANNDKASWLESLNQLATQVREPQQMPAPAQAPAPTGALNVGGSDGGAYPHGMSPSEQAQLSEFQAMPTDPTTLPGFIQKAMPDWLMNTATTGFNKAWNNTTAATNKTGAPIGNFNFNATPEQLNDFMPNVDPAYAGINMETAPFEQISASSNFNQTEMTPFQAAMDMVTQEVMDTGDSGYGGDTFGQTGSFDDMDFEDIDASDTFTDFNDDSQDNEPTEQESMLNDQWGSDEDNDGSNDTGDDGGFSGDTTGGSGATGGGANDARW